jgi:hypothetical protein
MISYGLNISKYDGQEREFEEEVVPSALRVSRAASLPRSASI